MTPNDRMSELEMAAGSRCGAGCGGGNDLAGRYVVVLLQPGYESIACYHLRFRSEPSGKRDIFATHPCAMAFGKRWLLCVAPLLVVGNASA